MEKNIEGINFSNFTAMELLKLHNFCTRKLRQLDNVYFSSDNTFKTPNISGFLEITNAVYGLHNNPYKDTISSIRVFMDMCENFVENNSTENMYFYLINGVDTKLNTEAFIDYNEFKQYYDNYTNAETTYNEIDKMELLLKYIKDDNAIVDGNYVIIPEVKNDGIFVSNYGFYNSSYSVTNNGSDFYDKGVKLKKYDPKRVKEMLVEHFPELYI